VGAFSDTGSTPVASTLHKEGEGPIRSRLRWTRASAAVLAATLVLTGCTRHVTVPPSHQLTIYYCRVGSGNLVRMPFTIDPNLNGQALATYAVNQLLAGPAVGRDSLVLFPAGTQATVTMGADTATVDFGGSLAHGYRGGAGDEAAMFKSLTYTLTALPGVKRVQVLVGGHKQDALPGGHFEIDEPLSRDTFAQ
jgi:spore germination protein GerM